MAEGFGGITFRVFLIKSLSPFLFNKMLEQQPCFELSIL